MRQPIRNSLVKAIDAVTGTLVSIKDESQAPSSARLLCPDCEASVIPARGEVYAWHFRHLNASECSHSVSETPLHKSAKAVIAEAKEITLPTGSFFGRTHRVAIQKCELEKNNDRVCFDALLQTDKGQVAIEICVTHRVDERKTKKLAAIGIPCVEITLSRDDAAEDLSDKVLHRAPRDWAYEPETTFVLAAYDRAGDTSGETDSSLAPGASIEIAPSGPADADPRRECAYKAKSPPVPDAPKRPAGAAGKRPLSLGYIKCLIVAWDNIRRSCCDYLDRTAVSRGGTQTPAPGVDAYSVTRLEAFCEREIEDLNNLVDSGVIEDVDLKAESALVKLEMAQNRKQLLLPALEHSIE